VARAKKLRDKKWDKKQVMVNKKKKETSAAWDAGVKKVKEAEAALRKAKTEYNNMS